MSIRNVVEDERILVPGQTYKYGRYFSLYSNGVNQARGQPLAPHNYSMNMTDEYEALTVQVNCKTGAVVYSKAGATAVASRPWTSSDDYFLYGKLERAYDKGDFNAGVFAGELGRSVDMLADRTKQLAKALIAAKKGRFAQAAYILGVGGDRKVSPSTRRRHRDDAGPQSPQRVSDGWLELQYGWKPLVQDVYTLADQIARSDKPRQRKIVARHSIPMIANSVPGAQFQATGGGSVSKQIIAYITEDIPSWPQALGLMDPEIVAWELVPFSFVVDWFIPVGNWLKARAFASRAKGTFVVTERTKYNARLASGSYLLTSQPCQYGTYTKTVTLGWRRYVSLTRTVRSSLPQVPLPVFTVGGLDKGNRLANAAALLANIFPRHAK